MNLHEEGRVDGRCLERIGGRRQHEREAGAARATAGDGDHVRKPSLLHAGTAGTSAGLSRVDNEVFAVMHRLGDDAGEHLTHDA